MTDKTSVKSTTPNNKAITAPPIADQPIFNPFGCQITNTSVAIKIIIASISVVDKTKPPKLTTRNSCTFFFKFF